MDDQTWFNRMTLVVCFAVVVVGASAVAVAHEIGPATASPASSGPAPVDHLYLTIAFNPATGMDEYFPANFTVPVNTLVIVTITNYDNGTNVVAPQYAQVTGTADGTATAIMAGSSAPQSYSSLPLTNIAHTLTLMQGPVHLNVPVPPAGPTGLPTVVQFSAEFTQVGSFVWNCMAPCDSGSMATPGLMAGMITVE